MIQTIKSIIEKPFEKITKRVLFRVCLCITLLLNIILISYLESSSLCEQSQNAQPADPKINNDENLQQEFVTSVDKLPVKIWLYSSTAATTSLLAIIPFKKSNINKSVINFIGLIFVVTTTAIQMTWASPPTIVSVIQFISLTTMKISTFSAAVTNLPIIIFGFILLIGLHPVGCWPQNAAILIQFNNNTKIIVCCVFGFVISLIFGYISYKIKQQNPSRVIRSELEKRSSYYFLAPILAAMAVSSYQQVFKNFVYVNEPDYQLEHRSVWTRLISGLIIGALFQSDTVPLKWLVTTISLLISGVSGVVFSIVLLAGDKQLETGKSNLPSSILEIFLETGSVSIFFVVGQLVKMGKLRSMFQAFSGLLAGQMLGSALAAVAETELTAYVLEQHLNLNFLVGIFGAMTCAASVMMFFISAAQSEKMLTGYIISTGDDDAVYEEYFSDDDDVFGNNQVELQVIQNSAE
jgi:hypothetical protein